MKLKNGIVFLISIGCLLMSNLVLAKTVQNNFQRIGAVSNAHIGNDFEMLALEYFKSQGVELQKGFPFKIGAKEGHLKKHNFDLGSHKDKIMVECKSHKWTSGNKVPSAKMTTWNQAMYYFYLSPKNYKKIFFVQKDIRKTTGESLAEYYIRTRGHLIPDNVEIWEYDLESDNIKKHLNQ